MIDLTATINNDEALRKLRQLQQTAKQTTSNIVSDADRMDMAMARLARTLGQVGAGVSLVGLVKQIGQVRSEFQQLEIAFSTMLQSESKATALMSQLTKTAATTPFGLQDVANGAKQLLAYGTSAEKVNETLIRLGDIAAGLSIPLGDLVYLYGTTQTQGRLFTQDLRQFQGRGIPLAEELAKQFGVTSSEVGKLVTAGKVGFPEVEKAIISMTSAGGKFGGLMEAQSKTIGGLVSNLEDAFDMMFNEIGQQTEGVMAGVLKTTINLVENYEKVLDILVPIVATYGAYRAALIAVAAAQKLNMAVMRQAVREKLALAAAGQAVTKAQLVQLAQTKLLTLGWKSLATSIKTASLAMLASPVTWITAALAGLALVIYKVATAETAQEKAQRQLNERMDEYKTKQEELKSKAEDLHSVMKDDATTAYKKEEAYKSLIAAYPELLKKYDKEKIMLMDIVALRKELNNITDQRTDAELQATYQKGLADYNYYNEEVETTRQQGAAGVIERGARDPRKAEAALAIANEAKAEMDRRAKIKADSASADEKIIALQKEKNKLKEEEKQIDIDIANAKKKAAQDAESGRISLPNGRDEGSLQTSKQENLNRQKEIDREIKQLEESKKVKKMISDKEKDKLKKLAKEAQKEIAQAEVDAMAEGTPKVLAQIELDYKKREAEIKKWEDDIKKIRGGKLTDEEAESASTMRRQNDRNRTDARMAALYTEMPSHSELAAEFEAELDALDEYAIKYGNYYEKILATKDKYSRLIAEADTAGEKMMLEEEMNAALVELEMEGLQYYEHIKGLTDEVLKDALSAMEDQLAEAEDKIAGNPDMSADDTKALKAQIAVLKVKIAALQNEADARGEDNGDSYEEWAKRAEVIGDLADKFKQLGKEIGGVAGKAITTAGEVGTGVVSIINNIEKLGKMAAEGTETAASGAVAAIKMVEKGTVILAIISTAIQVAQTLYSLFSKGADYSDYEALKAKYEDLNEVWDQLLDKKKEYIEMSYGAEADKVGEEAIDIIKKQIESYKELGKARLKSGASAGSHSIGVRQMNRMTASDKQDVRDAAAEYGFDANKVLSGRMTELFNLTTEQLIGLRDNAQSFWAKLDDDVREYLNNIIEAEERIKEINDSVAEQLTQISFDSLYDSFVDSLMDMDKSAKDFSEDFSKYMMKAMLATAVGNTYRKQLEDWYQSFAKANNDKEGITPEERAELRESWDSIAKSAIELRDTLADATGYGDTVDAQQASARGFQAMSQEVGNELNGRFTDIQGKITDMRAQGEERLMMSRRQLEEIAYIRSVIDRGVNYAQDTRDVLLNISGDVSEIRMFAETLPRIHEAIAKTNRILDNKL